MGTSLGYELDKVHLKTQAYRPTAHGETELQEAAIRKGLADLLGGKRPLEIVPVAPPEEQPPRGLLSIPQPKR